MNRAARFLTRTVEWSMATLLAIMVVLVFANAAGRYVLASGFPEGEEIARLCFVWLIFFGAALAVHERAHVGIDMVVQRFGTTGKKLSLAAMNLLILYALWLFAEGSWQQTVIGMESRTAVTGIPQAAYAVAGLVCAVAMAALYMIDLVRLMTGRVREADLVQVRETAGQDEVLIAADGKAAPVAASPEAPKP
jgi:TRAP-type C4-dicarboxylate transport system permease small subunit